MTKTHPIEQRLLQASKAKKPAKKKGTRTRSGGGSGPMGTRTRGGGGSGPMGINWAIRAGL